MSRSFRHLPQRHADRLAEFRRRRELRLLAQAERRTLTATAVTR